MLKYRRKGELRYIRSMKRAANPTRKRAVMITHKIALNPHVTAVGLYKTCKGWIKLRCSSCTLEVHKLPNVSLEILVRTLLENQSTPRVRLLLKGGPYGPLWNTLVFRNLPGGISWIRACCNTHAVISLHIIFGPLLPKWVLAPTNIQNICDVTDVFAFHFIIFVVVVVVLRGLFFNRLNKV